MSERVQDLKVSIRQNLVMYASLVIVLIFGFILSLVAYSVMRLHQDNEAQRAFVNSAEKYTLEFNNSLDKYLYDMVAFKAFFSVSNFVDADEFCIFSDVLFNRHKHIKSIYYLPDSKDTSGVYNEVDVELLSKAHKCRLGDAVDFDDISLSTDPYYADVLDAARTGRNVVLMLPKGQALETARYFIYFRHVETAGGDVAKAPRQAGVVVIVLNFDELIESVRVKGGFYGIVPTLREAKLLLDHDSFQRVHDVGLLLGGHDWVVSFVAEEGAFVRNKWSEKIAFLSVFLVFGILSFFMFLFLNRRGRDKRIKTLLKSEQEEAEQATQYKSDFLANMSHELRTPLNSIVGMVQIIEQSDLDEEVGEMFSLVRGASLNLLEIVNDILDLSKIEAGQVHLECIAFDAVKRIRDTVDTMQPLASEKGIGLHCRIDTDYLYALGDELRFTRVLTNLISNSIRYTLEGNVSVIVKTEKLFDNLVRLRCEVIDTGIGVPKDKMKSIFDKFTQADASITRKFGGTGLGLTITRGLVELMDGEVGVESIEGEGSNFWFEVPFGVVDELPESTKREFAVARGGLLSTDAISVGNVRVLLVEDNEMNQIFMKKLFATVGLKNYMIAADGRQAVQAVQDNQYDLVLMDCHMPEMNGYDATVAIRNLPDTDRASIPIIAMTANAMPEDEDKCLAIGMDAYISKPVDIIIFQEILTPWISFEINSKALNKQNKTWVEQSVEVAPANLDNLRNNAMGDEVFISEIISMFVSQGADQIAQLKGQCTDGVNEIWVEIAHALKGTSGIVGAEIMRELCARAQKLHDGSAQEREGFVREIEGKYFEVKKFFIQEKLFDD